MSNFSLIALWLEAFPEERKIFEVILPFSIIKLIILCSSLGTGSEKPESLLVSKIVVISSLHNPYSSSLIDFAVH